MNTKLAWTSGLLSTLVLILGFYLFYSGSDEAMKSGFAAIISASLVFLACYTLGWFFQVFED